MLPLWARPKPALPRDAPPPPPSDAFPMQSSIVLPDGSDAPVHIRRSKRARRIIVHVDTIDGAVELVLPYRAPLSEGLQFAQSKSRWVAGRLRDVSTPVTISEGTVIPVLGNDLRVRHFEQSLRAVDRNGDEILVSGDAEDVSELVQTWLRQEARREISPRVAEKTAILGRSHSKIAIRDPRTLWGSCTRAGNLSFSWRLVLAPPEVLDYVVAHEVAHLAEMNHGPGFWATVDRLCGDARECRAWLRQNGRALHRYR